MKKILTLVLTVILAVGCCFSLTACGNNEEDFKVGLICLHGESSTYDKNFIDAFKAACEVKGVKYVLKVDIDENDQCLTTATDMVDQGCNLIFADSFGHETYILQAARENPNVQFCHATGTKASLSIDTDVANDTPANFHNAFASIYEGRFLAGVAAGMKLVEMAKANQIKASALDGTVVNVGYIGAWPYAEVISGYTSWYLGVRYVMKNSELNDSVLTDVTMDVTYTNSWYTLEGEGSAAEALIPNCALISQHADSMGAPNACETAGVPNVSYNGSTAAACPNTFIISSRINWQPYFEYIIDCAKNGTEIVKDYCGDLQTGSVALTEVGAAAAEGTQAVIDDLKAKLIDGTLNVFDTNTFTVNNAKANDQYGKITADENGKLVSYLADIIDLGDFAGETNAVEDGIFTESSKRSAPYFDIVIDGITIIG